jgi:hypothetical protein
MERTGVEIIKFVKDYISAHGTTENFERLLYRMENENVIQADLIPEEIFHDLCQGNVSSIPLDMVPKFQDAYPDYDLQLLAMNGRIVMGKEVTA